MYKLVAIDLDGTLLNNYGDISENTKTLLKEIISNGVEVVLTSGRTIDSIRNFSTEINSNNYIIGLNGGLIYDLQKNEIIFEKSISKLKALNILKICDENSIFYSIYTDRSIIATSLKHNVLYYYKENLKKEDSKKTSLKIVENIYDYISNTPDEKIMKILIADETRSVFNSIIKKISDLEDIEVLDVIHSSKKTVQNGSQEILIEYYCTEVSKKNVDKWNAIKILADKLGIKENEIIAIGDNVNDINMIKNAGLGIAMKGSSPKVTEISDLVSEFDNNNDGVALELKKIFL